MGLVDAVVPVAGLGTRLLPATKSQPKEMLPVVGKPVPGGLMLSETVLTSIAP